MRPPTGHCGDSGPSSNHQVAASAMDMIYLYPCMLDVDDHRMVCCLCDGHDLFVSLYVWPSGKDWSSIFRPKVNQT
jgi:hypothetical protein